MTRCGIWPPSILGNPLRYQEVFTLNRGISQADGHTLVDPNVIYPG